MKWKQPKSPLQIVVLVEGEIEGRVTIASTASEYPLADFALFRSLARTVKIACWGAGLRWRPQSVKRFEAPTAERQKARREEQDYAAVRRNVEEFLSPPRQAPARQKDMELE